MGIKWHAKSITFFFGRIPSNYLFGLETTGQRKTQGKSKKSLRIKAGTRMKEISFHTGDSGQLCVFYMQNTYNLFNTLVNQYSIY